MKLYKIEPGIQGKTYIVQGFGNVGYWFSYFLTLNGGTIIGVAENNGSIYNAKGLDTNELLQHKKKTGSLLGFKGAAKEWNTEDAIYEKCDVFVPAAMEQTINKGNAHRFNCKIVAEGANGPTTVAAEEILTKKGVYFFPDILMNAGGVTVSYFEWLQNLEHMKPGRLTKKWGKPPPILLINRGAIEDGFLGCDHSADWN